MDVRTADAAGLVAFVLFFLVLGMSLWSGWRWFRRHASGWEAVYADLRTQAFEPADAPDLAARLLPSHAPAGTPPPRLLKRPGSGSIEWVVCPPAVIEGPPTAVAIQSARLAVPRFLLLPGTRDGHRRGYGSDAHLHELVSPDAPEIRYPPVRLADTRHTLSADHVARVEPLFDRELRAWLQATDGLALRGDGDLLVVWLRWPIGVGWAPGLESDPVKGLACARHCHEALRRRG